MTLFSHQIDNLFVRVAKILTYGNGQPLTNATGFFYLHDNFLYLITARHVVTGEGTNQRPDALKVSLHTNKDDLTESVNLDIPLYREGECQFWEHPDHGSAVDLVAVSVNDPAVLSKHFVATFRASDIADAESVLSIGQDVLIVGFPLGFHDTLNNLPIVRRATIASSYSHPFKGNPYFLTDARLHRGTSGSPVIAYLPVKSSFGAKVESGWKLLGIHSSSLDVSDREADKDEKLALNMTWYASLISEMLPTRSQTVQSTGNTRSSLEASTQ